MAKMIQVRNVPDDVHGRLKARAALAGMSLSDYLKVEMTDLASRPSIAELDSRVRNRSVSNVTIADAVAAVRDARRD